MASSAKLRVGLVALCFALAACGSGEEMDAGAALDASASAPDAGEPNADASVPNADAGDPEADASDPNPDASEPNPDASDPVPDASDPDASDPDAGASDPDAGASDPDAGASDPDAGASDPDASAAPSDGGAGDATPHDSGESDAGLEPVCFCPTTEATITDYWANGPDDIWAVGTSYQPALQVAAIFHWDGVTWSRPTIESPSGPPYQSIASFRAVAGIGGANGSQVRAIGDLQERVRGTFDRASGVVRIEWLGAINECGAEGIWISASGNTVVTVGDYGEATGLFEVCRDWVYTVTLQPPNPQPDPNTWISDCEADVRTWRDAYASWTPELVAVQERSEGDCNAIGARTRPNGDIDHFPVLLTLNTSGVYARSIAGTWVSLADASLIGVPCGIPRVYARRVSTNDLYSFDGTGGWVLSNQDEPLLAMSPICQTNDPPQPPLPACNCAGTAPIGVPDPVDALHLISSNTAGLRGDWDSTRPSLSADGRYVSYVSQATNLVPDEVVAVPKIFLRDRLTGRTSRSSDRSGSPGEMVQTTISNDGRYVEMLSFSGVALYDRQTELTVYIGAATDAKISPDGSLILFSSSEGSLVPNDLNAMSDTFVYETATGTITRVSASSAGVEGNGQSVSANINGPAISADNRFVVFSSLANNFVAGDNNFSEDVFVRDRQTGDVSLVSVSSTGVPGNGSSSAPAISADGRFVVFLSVAGNLVAGDTFGTFDVFVHDRLTGTTVRENVSSAGVAANGVTSAASISADGRYLVFSSAASNLVPGDTNNQIDVFVRDRQSGTTERVAAPGADATISADGRYIAFSSRADLTNNDNNNSYDVFVIKNPLAP